MTTEQLLLERWRNLNHEQQQTVIDFVEFLHGRQAPIQTSRENKRVRSTSSPIGKRLWQLRQEIIDTGMPLLNQDDLETEIASRRGGVNS